MSGDRFEKTAVECARLLNERRALMDSLRALWVAFGRDPDDEASYVTEHGVGNVIVNDFAVAIS